MLSRVVGSKLENTQLRSGEPIISNEMNRMRYRDYFVVHSFGLASPNEWTAEEAGFEPAVGLPPRQFSKLVPSAARSPLHEVFLRT